MPSKSWKQHRFFEMAVNDPAFARKNNISQKTAKEFLDEDRRKGLWQTAPKKADQDKPKGRLKESKEDIQRTLDPNERPGTDDHYTQPPIDRVLETQVIMT